MAELGILFFFVSIFCIGVGIILLLISIGVKEVRKPAMYTLLAGGISMLLCVGCCSVAPTQNFH